MKLSDLPREKWGEAHGCWVRNTVNGEYGLVRYIHETCGGAAAMML